MSFEACFNMLGLLLAAHALCDYPFQGDFLAKGKNHRDSLPGVPWYQCLLAHSLIHAGAVGVITGSSVMAICEFFAHFTTDYAKNEGLLTFDGDQAVHYACKVLWVWMIWTSAYLASLPA